MDKILYISYEYFKKEPNKGISVNLKDGSEFFYQFMYDANKRMDSKYADLHPVGMIRVGDVSTYNPVKTDGSAEQFLSLVEGYTLSPVIEKSLKKDLLDKLPKKSDINSNAQLIVKVDLPQLGLVYAEDNNNNRYFLDKGSNINFSPKVGQVLSAKVNDESYVVSANLMTDVKKIKL